MILKYFDLDYKAISAFKVHEIFIKYETHLFKLFCKSEIFLDYSFYSLLLKSLQEPLNDCVQTLMFVYEELLLKDKEVFIYSKIEVIDMIGWEGIWGMIFSFIILLFSTY